MLRAVVCMTARSIARLKRPLIIVRKTPPAAPTEAASVADAMPAKIEPSTPTMSTRAGTSAIVTRLRASARKTRSSSAGMGGASSGLKWARMTRSTM